MTRRIRIAFPSSLPEWLSGADVFEVVQIPNTNIKEDYTPTINHPQEGNWELIVDSETGCAVKEDDSTIIIPWAGGHADGCYNQIVTLRLSDNVPAFEEFDPGSENSIIPSSPQTGTTLSYLSDGRPIGAHNYDRAYFLNEGIPSLGTTPRLVRMQTPATWAWNATSQVCASYLWDESVLPEDRTDPAGTIPDIPAVGTQLVTATTCKDPLTDDIFWWHGTSIWKWTRATNSWGTAAWKTGFPTNGGLMRPIACNGSQFVVAYGAILGEPPYVYSMDIVTKVVSGPLLVTGSGAAGFQDIRGTAGGGTRARLIWVPPLNSYLLMRGNGATGNNIIYRLQYNGTDWVSEALPLTGVAIPSQTALGPQSKMQWIPGLNGVFYADRGENDMFFFRIA